MYFLVSNFLNWQTIKNYNKDEAFVWASLLFISTILLTPHPLSHNALAPEHIGRVAAVRYLHLLMSQVCVLIRKRYALT